MASLDLALAVVPHAPLLGRFRAVGRDAAELTPFGYIAALTAYSHAECAAWRRRRSFFCLEPLCLACMHPLHHYGLLRCELHFYLPGPPPPYGPPTGCSRTCAQTATTRSPYAAQRSNPSLAD